MEKIVELLLKIIDILTGYKDERETPDADFEGEASIGLIVGHTRRAPGASFALGGNEYDYNSDVARIAKAYCDVNFKNIKTHIIFRDVIGIAGAYKKATDLNCDVVIELHFNAFNKSVTGTETLTTTHVGDKAFGLEIQKMMCKVFDRQGLSRGLKPISRSARGGRNVYSFQGYNCLVEPFFGDAPSEARLANEKKEEYAEGLIEASIKFCKEHLGILK
jgi:N-acetylmuramoyl-L-alanine amidase